MLDRTRESLLTELKSLEQEHLELDDFVDSKLNKTDELTFQRIKKRKLIVKDKINYIKSILYPDIYA